MTPVADADDSVPRANSLLIFCFIVAGAALRLGLSAISLGTNDAVIWQKIASQIDTLGLIGAYRSQPLINHPPGPMIWSWLSLRAGPWFTDVMKLPAIAADLAACALLARIWLNRGQTRRATLAVAAMAFNPVAIIISAYHCNTDSLYAFLSLLAMYFIADRQRFFAAGLALGAAINIKLTPVVLIPAALSFCRSWRQAVQLVGALAIASVPFMLLLALAPDVLARNLLGYMPPVSQWGVGMLLHDVFTHPPFAHTAKAIMAWYLAAGRWAIIAAAVASGAASWWLKRWNAYELGLICYAMLLVLAPGFGWQYLVIVVPLLLAVSIAQSWIYAVLAGLFLLLSYWSRLVSYSLPLLTYFPPDTPTPPGATFGLLAWGLLLQISLARLWGRCPDRSRP